MKMLKKIISIIAIACCALFARDYAKIAVAIASTDLSNINKSEYVIWTDLDGVVGEQEGENLCLDARFAKHVDSFTCKKPIVYHLGEPQEADIIITNDGVEADALVFCLEDSDNCDVIIGQKKKKIKFNKDSMTEKGFVADPGRQW